MMRKIIHVDMDAFYASVEQRDHPELRGKPVAVGHDGPRGVVSTASYEARRFGVCSAMPVCNAKRACPQLIVVPHRDEAYREVSMQIREVFREYTDVIEPISLDEAFLDVTDNKKGIDDPLAIALEIKRKIWETTRLTASAGVSYNKFLAKIASDYRKPDGLFVVNPGDAYDFVGQLRIEKFWGIGPKTARQMHEMGIFTGEQLRAISERHLVEVFGKMGSVYYHDARGDDERPVVSHWIRKSVGCERTFPEDLTRRSAVVIELYHTVLELVERIRETGFEGQTLTLKIKFYDFTQITRSVTADHRLHTKDQILPLAKGLSCEVDCSRRPIRLMGLSLSNPHAGCEAQREKRWAEGWIDGFEDA